MISETTRSTAARPESSCFQWLAGRDVRPEVSAQPMGCGLSAQMSAQIPCPAMGEGIPCEVVKRSSRPEAAVLPPDLMQEFAPEEGS